ncbi:MAG TPA: alginate lyase family protein [Terriglobales bacterium]|nr:alginate lyase family protein [Terriglobales bacterium]
MLSPTLAFKVVRDLGPPWVMRRLWFDLQRTSGWLKLRHPTGASYQNGTEFRSGLSGRGGLGGHSDFAFGNTAPASFFFSQDQFPAVYDAASVCSQADRILAGEWPFFSHRWIQVGFPPRWNRNAVTGAMAPQHLHWSETPVESSFRSDGAEPIGAFGDVKFIWEMSRFSPVFLLARAYAASRDCKYASAFWTLVEDWAEKNSPNTGVNWTCGQEASVRVLAWCFGLHAFRNAPCSSAARVENLATIIQAHGIRIAGHIGYALTQRNNHGISEAVGLLTIGTLFPRFSQSGKWARTGQKLIKRQLRDQFYEDGSYIQHSFNYERLVLDELLWAFRLAELNGCRFSDESYEVLKKALEFLLMFCDPETGRMPNCGANDGSRLLQLSPCDYSDYRPTLQALSYLVHRRFCFPDGPWNELARWLFGTEAHHANVAASRRVSVQDCKDAAYQSLQARESHAMLRTPTYRDRPAQADQLHLDIWWRGENLVCDPGTYLYNGEHPWNNALASAFVHNSVTVADREPMTRAGRFLWLDWADATSRRYSLDENTQCLEAAHNGYQRIQATHKRSVLWREDEDFWIVVDDVMGRSGMAATVQWLFPNLEFTVQQQAQGLILQSAHGPFRFQIVCSQNSQMNLVRAGELIAGPDWQHSATIIRGWRSPVYGDKEPALSVGVRSNGGIPARFVTVLAPANVRIGVLSPTEILVARDRGEYRFRMNPPGDARAFRALG